MLPSSLPLPQLWNFLLRSRMRIELVPSEFASDPMSFIKVLPLSLPQKFNRFHIPAQYETAKCIRCKKKQASLLCKLFYLTCVVDRTWYGMEDDFSIFHTGNFLPFHFHSMLEIFHSIFHSILNFSSIFHSILPGTYLGGPWCHALPLCVASTE